MKQKYYEGSSKIINLSTEIGKLLGIVDSAFLWKPTAKLRKVNRIKSIQSSLWIEGNSLSEKQVSDIIENRKVLGPEKDIIEVKNAIRVCNNIRKFKYDYIKSYLSAHKLLLKGLVKNIGKFRTQEVGVNKGEEVAHLAPPGRNVEHLMKEIFNYLFKSQDNPIIKSCVFQYEMEFIHPFMDGNGRMERLWQTVILMQENPVFEFLPIEHEIKSELEKYYNALSISDKQGVCTAFIEYMLGMIKKSLTKLVSPQKTNLSGVVMPEYFKENFKKKEFARKDYLEMFKDISTATATRDLKKGIEENL